MRYVVEKYLAPFHQWSLKELGEDPRAVRQLHAELTKRNGVYPANHAMRALRAIYNYEARTNYDLPPNPVSRAVEFNREASLHA